MRIVLTAWMVGAALVIGSWALGSYLRRDLPHWNRPLMVYAREDYPTEDFQWALPRWHPIKGTRP